MPLLKILNNQIFLVSPLDIPVYVFQIPPVKEDRRKEEIIKQLRVLYPGNPEDTFIDYRLFRKENPAGFTVTAFVCPRAAHELYRKIKSPLTPGISLMNPGARKFTEQKKTVILFTSEWIELACFEGAEPVKYASCKRDSLSFIASFPGEGTSKEAAVLINAEPAGGSGEDIQKLLENKFASVTLAAINDLKIGKHLKTMRIFSSKGSRFFTSRKKLIHALLVLNGVFLALVLCFVSSRLDLKLEALQKVQQEQQACQEEERRLGKEIAGLRSRLPERSIYEVISEIQSSLPRGWIRSLTIQDEDLSLEAEGTDSLSTFNNLQNSPCFSDLLIQHAAPSAIEGERFTIFGKVCYGKE
jgi:hypothetical protein